MQNPRRTIIADSTATNVRTEDLLMPEEDTWITLTVNNKLGRSYQDEPPKITTSVKRPPRFIVQGSTSHILYVFTTDGDCATIPVQQIPQVQKSRRRYRIL